MTARQQPGFVDPHNGFEHPSETPVLDAAPTQAGPAIPWAGLPLWYRRLSWAMTFVLVTLVVLVTLLVAAWRAPESGVNWAKPLLALEFVAISVTAIWGRPAYQRLLAWKYRFLRSRRGIAATVTIAVVLLGPFLPALFRQGSPVTDATGRRVAVVGAGTAGLHAAWMLNEAGIDFDVYEAADYIGGHAFAPVFTPEKGEPFACDVGFIFGSPADYHEMKVLMDWYGVERNPSELSMSGNVNGVQWGSGPDISTEAVRFQKLAEEQHRDARWNLVPFDVWLALHGFSSTFQEQYITPLMSVLFITDLGLYEISTRFMLNMAAGRIQWVDFRKGAPAWTVRGGSAKYYERLSEGFSDKISLRTPVTKLERKGGKVQLTAYGPDGKAIVKRYDDVILAVPADVARQLVTDRDWMENFVLSQVRYRDAEVVLHTDDSLLPPKEYLRHYNYYKDEAQHGDEFELTGVMNWVHGAGEMSPLPIGSLNPLRPIDPEKVVLRRGWRHHAMDLWHLAMMLEVMPSIQGRGGIWYAGDWVTVIGHGPAMRTGMAAACNVGAKSRVRKPPVSARCIDVQTADARAGYPKVVEHLCGKEDIYAYLVEKACNGFTP